MLMFFNVELGTTHKSTILYFIELLLTIWEFKKCPKVSGKCPRTRFTGFAAFLRSCIITGGRHKNFENTILVARDMTWAIFQSEQFYCSTLYIIWNIKWSIDSSIIQELQLMFIMCFNRCRSGWLYKLNIHFYIWGIQSPMPICQTRTFCYDGNPSLLIVKWDFFISAPTFCQPI